MHPSAAVNGIEACTDRTSGTFFFPPRSPPPPPPPSPSCPSPPSSPLPSAAMPPSSPPGRPSPPISAEDTPAPAGIEPWHVLQMSWLPVDDILPEGARPFPDPLEPDLEMSFIAGSTTSATPSSLLIDELCAPTADNWPIRWQPDDQPGARPEPAADHLPGTASDAAFPIHADASLVAAGSPPPAAGPTPVNWPRGRQPGDQPVVVAHPEPAADHPRGTASDAALATDAVASLAGAISAMVAVGRPRLRCPHCTETYATSRALNAHVGFVHGNEGFRCVKCGKAYQVRGHLVTHVRNHHGLDIEGAVDGRWMRGSGGGSGGGSGPAM